MDTERINQIKIAWIEFADCYRELKVKWNAFNQLVTGFNRRHYDLLPRKIQKVVAQYKGQRFTVMMPRFVDQLRRYGGIESLILDKEA